jgi:hypothetical protein
MMGGMHGTSTPHEGVTNETWRLRWDVVKRRCEELGDRTDPERAARMGISRATLHRWKRGTHAPDISRAHRAEQAVGLAREVMWERVAA